MGFPPYRNYVKVESMKKIFIELIINFAFDWVINWLDSKEEIPDQKVEKLRSVMEKGGAKMVKTKLNEFSQDDLDQLIDKIKF